MLKPSSDNYRKNNGSPTPGLALDACCSQLGSLLERGYTEIALMEAKRRAEKAVTTAREAMVRAQTADRAKASFLANMSRELRNSLSAIVEYSERMKLRPDERTPERIECILEAGRQLLAIVRDVQDWAQVETGKMELAEEKAFLCKLLSGAIQRVSPLAEEKSINICSAPVSAEDAVWGDPQRLEQAFVYLLSNAIKSSKESGWITVVSYGNDGGGLAIAFSDTGSGVPKEELERAFDPFDRRGEPVPLGSTGTGLGLPIARALVRLHGGDLVLHSKPGVGTTAEVRLPADRVCANVLPIRGTRR